MSGTAFQQIPANFIPPLFYVEFNNSLAGEVGGTSQPTLIIGQALVSQPEAPVWVPSWAFAATTFGVQSMLARLAAIYFAGDPIGPLYMLPLADAAGAAAATGSVTFSGTATGGGAIYLYIGGQRIVVPVNVGDTAATVATNAAALVNAGIGFGVTATAVSGAVDFTAVHKGALGNAINLATNLLGAQGGETTPPGISVAITAMAGGTIDPDLAGVAAALGDQQFDFICHPYAESAQDGEMSTLMSDTSGGRWAWNRQVYGHVFTALNATPSAMVSFVSAMNDQHTSVIQNPGSPNPPAEVLAAAAGAIAPSLRNLASQPLNTLQLLGVMPAPAADWNTLAEEQQILTAGGSVLRFDRYGNTSIGQMVTTYKTNAYGQPDASYRYVTTLFTLMAITRQLRAALVTKFARCIVVPNGTKGSPNVPLVTPNAVKAEIVAQYRLMEAAGLVVNATAMAAATGVTIDPNNPGRINVVWRPELANGLDMLAMINQFVLNPAA